jgi:5'-nucleotidase (lipoprotein e(P4) family)
MRQLAGLIALIALAGCAGRAPVPLMTTDPSPAASATLPPAIHWSRNAAEHSAVFRQTYRIAGERLRGLVAGRAAGSWAVILDADETVLDNSTYQKERAAIGLGYTSDSWNEWVRRIEATALPGANEFIASARALGGRVAIVTNRIEAVCAETRENLVRIGVVVDVVLCRPPESSDKNPRFQAVQNGTTGADLPPLDVVMWVGDNIQDFPGLDQDLRMMAGPSYTAFGERYIILPNPMYGSWESNPAR